MDLRENAPCEESLPSGSAINICESCLKVQIVVSGWKT